MSPIRREGDGRPQFAHSWESLVERRIRESMEAGEFQNLPFAGERIPIDDDGSDMALAHHVLKQAGFAPGWIATDAEIRLLLTRREALFARVGRAGPPVRDANRRALSELVAEINRLVLRLEHEAPTTGQHRRRLDLAAELAALEAAARGEAASGGDSPDRR
jgi:Domain of unknown function (DUF1992)